MQCYIVTWLPTETEIVTEETLPFLKFKIGTWSESVVAGFETSFTRN